MNAAVEAEALIVIGTIESDMTWNAVDYNSPIKIGIAQWTGGAAAGLLGALDAADIQREAYKHSQNIRHSVYTPPYLELSAQLLAQESQIFEAAASHLTAIAKSRRKYAPEIKTIFSEVIAGRKLSQDKLDYLTRKMEEI